MVQFKPNTTVAAIVKKGNEFLFVEEIDGGKPVFNQPAGHLESDESLVEAIKRELYEETGLQLEPQYLVGMYYFYLQPANTYFLRFCFAFEADDDSVCQPHDNDIIATHWFTADEIKQKSTQWRSELVGLCFDDYLKGQHIPLTALKSNL